MRKAAYRKALDVARDDLEKLLRQREDLERRIARTRETVISLQLLTDDAKYDPAQYLPVNLTEAAARAIVASRVPLAPMDIRRSIERIGFNISSSNPLASVHSVLNRLVERNEVRKVYRQNTDGAFVRLPHYWWGDDVNLPKGWVAPTQEEVNAGFRAASAQVWAMHKSEFDKATEKLAKRAKGAKREPSRKGKR